ncbi:MAG: glutaminyl-peptide cyclotransferase [Agarilytica sp.]
MNSSNFTPTLTQLRSLISHSIVATLLSLACIACTAIVEAEENLSYEVLTEQTQDPAIFTQGFTKVDDTFYYSSGLYGRSFLKKETPEQPERGKTFPLPKHIFAEGSTLLNGQLFLITWREGLALMLDRETLQPKKQMRYQGEGWGLTHNGKDLIMSNGSSDITFRNPDDFKPLRKISVHNAWRKYKNINELEYAEGAIWANVWQSALVLKISPKDGRVLAIVNLDTLVKKHSSSPQRNVLNGIAYDEQRKAFWVTGKNWPRRYLVRFKQNTTTQETK